MNKLICFLFAFVAATQLFAQSIEFELITQDVNDLDAQKYPVRYGEGDEEKICALVKVQLPLQGVVFENDFIIGNPQFKVNEYWVYMAEGAAKMDVKHPDYPKLSVLFGFKLESKMTYVLKMRTVDSKPIPAPIDNKKLSAPSVQKSDSERDFSIYIGPEVQPLGFMGVGGMAGFYAKRFNVEINYVAGMTKSDEVYWNSTTTSSVSSYSYEYTPSYAGIALGYAVTQSRSFRLTPQVGLGSVSLKGTELKKGTNNPDATSGYAMTAHIGARMDICLGRSFRLFAAPQFAFAVSKSDLFQRVENVSSTIKNYASGLSGRVGFYFEF